MSDGATMSTPTSACTRRSFVVQHITVGIEYAILTMAGVGVERYVGQYAQLGKTLFQFAHGAGNQAIGIGRFDTIGRFQCRLDGGEQRQYRNA